MSRNLIVVSNGVSTVSDCDPGDPRFAPQATQDAEPTARLAGGFLTYLPIGDGSGIWGTTSDSRDASRVHLPKGSLIDVRA